MKIEINDQDIQVIGQALHEIKYSVAAPVLERLQKAINEAVELDKISTTSPMSPTTGADSTETNTEYNEVN